MADIIPIRRYSIGLGEMQVGETINWSWLSGTPTLGTAAAQDIGTSGAVLPLLNTENIWSATQIFSSAAITTAVEAWRCVSIGGPTDTAYGAFWRNDGSSLYLMFTNKGDSLGDYNSLRPLQIQFDTGAITWGGTQTIRGGFDAYTSGSITAYGQSFTFTLRDDTGSAGLALKSGDNSRFIRLNGTSIELINSAYSAVSVTFSNDGSAIYNGVVLPGSDGTYTLGSAANRWSQVYAANTSISSSDARLKTEPRDMTTAELAAFGAIARLPMVWKWLAKFECEGEDARQHSGPTVQAAVAEMTANGLDWNQYAAFCYDSWEAVEAQYSEIPAKTDDDGEITQEAVTILTRPAREAGDRYSFRKEELLWWCMRALFAEHDALTARISLLETPA